MFVLDATYQLVDQVFGASVQDLFEKVLVVVNVICHEKLGLEFLPDYVVFLLYHRVIPHQNCILQELVELLGTFVEGSQLIDLDVARIRLLVLRVNFEHLCLLVEVNHILSKDGVDDKLDITRSSQMNVVHAWLG